MKKLLKNFAKVAAISCIFAIGLGSVVSCDNGNGDDTNITDPNGNNGTDGENGGNGGNNTTDPTSSTLTEAQSAIVHAYDNVEKPTSITKSDSPTLFFAGDSTVQTYADEQFIGGWGQFLHLFLDNVETINAARGGRSSRSFINEGRLYDVNGSNYSFSENDKKSIEKNIKPGDFLFVQFTHNDDDTKGYTTMPDRMSPLGTPDENGIYPVTAPTSRPATTHLPASYTSQASDSEKATVLTDMAKYGDEYYSYDCGGTFKWYMQQYIHFARSKGAIPVLVTPVCRQSFDSNGKIRSGAGLHGDGFAYVKAVRQLAEEENCLLIDLFSETVKIQEKLYEQTTSTGKEGRDATFLHALVGAKSSDLAGVWPTDYDAAYGNPDSGYTKLDSTHYNKFGAFLCAAKIAEAIKNSTASESDVEYFYFKDKIKTTPTSFIDAPNRISKSNIDKIKALFPDMTVIDESRVYPAASEVIALITEKLGSSAETFASALTKANLNENKEKVAACREKYEALNFDDRDGVTNYKILTDCEKAIADFIEANRPKPTEVYFYHFSDLTQEKIGGTAVTLNVPDSTSISVETQTGSASPKGGTVTILGSDTSGKEVVVTTGNVSFTYNNTQYSVSKYLSCGLWSQPRYFEITVKENARVTVFAKSGSASEDRAVNIAKGDFKTNLQTIDANGSNVNNISFDLTDAGTYRIGSGKNTVYFYGVIVEYYPAE